MVNVKWFIYIIINSVCTALAFSATLNKPTKFPYSKCLQTSNNVTCEVLYMSKERRTKKSVWPPGPFAIPMSNFGCPESQSQGWSTGVITLKSSYGHIAMTEKLTEEKLIEKIDRNVLELQEYPHYIKWKLKFCVKLERHSILDKGAWLPGNYNIYKSGNSCPKGFKEFSRIRFFSEHALDGDVPTFSLGKTFGVDYINLTLCGRDSTDIEETNTANATMLETMFMLEKDRNNSCPMFNGTLTAEKSLLDDVENKYCFYTPEKSPDAPEKSLDELRSVFKIHVSTGYVEPNVQQIWFANASYLIKKNPSLSNAGKGILTWYQLDLMRSITVSKVGISFSYNIATDITDSIPLINCYYDNVKWSFADLEASMCFTVTKYIPPTLYLYMRNVFGRFITLLFYESDNFQLKLGQYVRVYTEDIETLGGELCNEDLGMMDGNIRDFQISASSWLQQHTSADARPFGSSWCASSSDYRPWILVDLIAITAVEGLTIYESSLVSFAIYHGTTVDSLQIYKEMDVSLREHEQMLIFPEPLKARFIELEVRNRSDNDKACLRFELRGCKLSGVPSLNCHNASEMFGLPFGLTTEQEAGIYNTSSEAHCYSLCLQEDNCSVSYFDNGDCVQYRPSSSSNWHRSIDSTGSWSAKMCAEDHVDMFPGFYDPYDGAVTTNAEVIETPALITTIGYPLSVGISQQYMWIVKFSQNRYVKIVFTNVSLGFETPSTHSSMDRLHISKYIWNAMTGKTIDFNFNERQFVVETSESLLFLTFVSCLCETVMASPCLCETGMVPRGFRAIITEEEIPACLSIDSELPWSERRNEVCNQQQMILTSMTILNFPFVNEERWEVQAGEHHNLQIEFLYFYVLCPDDPGELRSTFSVDDFPDNRTFCNTDMPPDKLYTKNSHVTIIFRKYEDNNKAMIRKEGFRIRYKKISHAFENFTELKYSKSISKVCSGTFNKCYSLYSSFITWKKANSLCWRKRQSLVSVQSTNELRYIYYLLRERRYREKRYQTVERDDTSFTAHIGLSRLRGKGRQGKFVWPNTAPMTFSAWRSGHPTTDDCTRVNFRYFDTDNTWESEHCTEGFAFYFICESQINDGKDTNTLHAKKGDFGLCGVNPNSRFKVNITYSGKPCQSWGSLTSDAYEDFAKRLGNIRLPITALNYCQDPSSIGVLWCYTTNVDILWEPCFLQQSFGHDAIDITTSKSSKNQHRCDNGTVIPTTNRCDGVFDCLDYSDESLCMDIIRDHFLIDIKDEHNADIFPRRLEIGSYYQCGTNEWISIIAKCDGFIDCLDASDEINCTRADDKCNENEFSCADGSCIHVSQVCDYVSDCENAEDEFCEHRPCGFNEFLCENKQCIPRNKRCNAIPDCSDNSDERFCESCIDSFRCDINTCILPRLVCDKFPDCEDGSDEKSCLHENILSCEQWWELGYQKSGKYVVDGIPADCDFSALSSSSRTLRMKIQNIDVTFEYKGALFTRSVGDSKLLLNEYKADGNKFKDMIYRSNYECTLKVKTECHLPESQASIFDDPYKRNFYAHCQCMEDTLKAEKITSMKAVYERPFGQLRKKRSFGGSKIRYRPVTQFVFKRINLTRCNGSILPHENVSNDMYYSVSTTESFTVDRRVLQKEIPVDVTVGPVTCSYEYKEYEPEDQIYCEGEDRKIPQSMLCLYDTDATDVTVGCRSGSYLQSCGEFKCPENTVHCPNSYCIPLRFMCDGRVHCPNGEDEKDCTCTDFGKEIVILTEDILRQSDSSRAALSLAKQLYSGGGIIRLLSFETHTRHKGLPLETMLLDIREQHIYPFKKDYVKHDCRYKSMARNIFQSLRFTKRESKGIVYIENSAISSRIAEILFSNISKPAFPIYRVLKNVNSLHRTSNHYTHVKDVVVNKWSSLFSLGYRRFPEICKAGSQVPCPGRYRCSSSKQCLPLEQVCDGIVQCIHADDERLCDFQCPDKCRCVGQVINCRSVGLHESEIRALSSRTRSIDLSQNPNIRNIFHQGILRFPFMLKLNVSSCAIDRVSHKAFLELHNLRSLDIGYNKLTKLPDNVFRNLHHLTDLNLDGNFELTVISSSAFHGLRSVRVLRISGTKLNRIAAYTFSGLILQKIDISNNAIEEIEDYAFNNISVQSIDFTGNKILKFNKIIFNEVTSLRELRTPAFKFCCIRPCYVGENDCFPAKNEFSSCGDLMRHPVLQATLWIVGIAALLGNIGSIFYRLVYDRERLKIGYGIFVTNLAAADFLMGVYLIIIATIDSLYRKRYIFMDDQWRNSNLCVTAGILSTVSSEASVLFLCLITLDRLLVIKYPFGTVRFGPRRAYICCGISWIFAFAIALIPVIYTGYFQNKFYSRSGVCIALPLTRDKPPGWIYSISVFVGLNFCTFILVAFGQLFIFLELRKTTSGMKKTQKSRKRDLQVARNLILVATTDFLCWFPIGLMGIIALNGHPISGDVYAWTAVFILPLNSALNPVLYTLTAIVGKKSFNPSTEEQSRTEIQKEIGSGILQYQQRSRSVRMKSDLEPVGTLRSIEDILNDDEPLSIAQLTAIASELTAFLGVLHESTIALEQLNETNTYLRFLRTREQKMSIVIDSKMIQVCDKRLIQENMYQYGILLRKMMKKTTSKIDTTVDVKVHRSDT